MLKEYRKLWIFGASTSVPNTCVSPQESFWGLVAKELDIATINNCSWHGNSFDSVCHMLIGMQDEYDWEKDVFLITIPPLWRLTIFDNFKDTRYYGYSFNTKSWDADKFEITCHTGLENFLVGGDKMLTIFEDRSWTETQTLRTIFLLTSWLDSKRANYLICNMTDPMDPDNIWGPSNFILPYCKNHTNCILFEDTYYSVNLNINKPVDFDQGGWYGHHGHVGNKYFFEQSLLPRLKKLNLC